MVVVTRKHLGKASEKYPDAAKEISAWFTIVSQVRWTSFEHLRATFPDADLVDGYVVFNIRRNRYRLITVVHFAKEGTQGHIYIRSFLTHKEYEKPSNWDKYRQ